jgi:hypothetical protein
VIAQLLLYNTHECKLIISNSKIPILQYWIKLLLQHKIIIQSIEIISNEEYEKYEVIICGFKESI